MPAVPSRTPLRLAPATIPWSPVNPHGTLAERGEGLGHNATMWGQPLQRAPQPHRGASPVWEVASTYPGYYMKNHESALAPSHGMPSYHAAYPQSVYSQAMPRSAHTQQPHPSTCQSCNLDQHLGASYQHPSLPSQPLRYAPQPHSYGPPAPQQQQQPKQQQSVFHEPNDSAMMRFEGQRQQQQPTIMSGASVSRGGGRSEFVIRIDRKVVEIATIVGGLLLIALLGFAIKGIIDIITN